MYDRSELKKYVSPLTAWALAFGCAVGWGAFMMPGTTFLPLAGPLGTFIGISIGAVIMIVIGINYHYMINQYPDAGGAFAYAKKSFGYDHGFLCAWFLIITYVAILWANATALPLIFRRLVGGIFQVGFHYQIAGFDIYFGEVLLSIAAIVVCGLICLRNEAAKWIQILMAVILMTGVVVCFCATWNAHQGGLASMAPAFDPDEKALQGVFNIVFLAPWAFVGFESISHSSEEFSFSAGKSGRIMIIAVVAAALAYILMALDAILMLPDEFASWPEYLVHLDELEGLKSMPTFYATSRALGSAGTVLLGLTAFGGIMTGLIGNYVASGRLLYSLAQEGMMPAPLAKLGRNNTPVNAILAVMAVSVIIPFFGRTATSWIVDVTTVGAAIAYAYTSTAAYKAAKRNADRKYIIMGGMGIAFSALFAVYFLIPNLLDVSTLSTESYMILALWSLLGFAAFLVIFRKDTTKRFGRSIVVWVVLLALIYFTSTVWLRQATNRAAEQAVMPIHDHYAEVLMGQGVDITTSASLNSTEYLNSILEGLSAKMSAELTVQTILIVSALAMIFAIYRIMQRREQQTEVEKALAEEVSRAKTSFLSNMSHEIRTPMNAIIGLDNIALKDEDLKPSTRDQLEKIGSSARHLLSLINDILDMSRIESGRMVLKEEDFVMREFLDQINVIINGQCADKGLEYECSIIGNIDNHYVGDDMKLKQVLINILGNSVKFTSPPGKVTFTVEQLSRAEGKCSLRFVMRDTGIGMDKEYIPKIFEAFSQEDATTTNKYGGSGLGMAITKNLVEMMGGTIDVDSEKGVGSTFTVTVDLGESDITVDKGRLDRILNDLRVIIVDDDPVACEHAKLVLGEIGIDVDTAEHSSDAFSQIRRKWDEGDPYDIVITDFRMPVMDGITLTEEIRRFDGGKTAVIILTGYDFDVHADRAHKSGVDGILTKPLFEDTLLREIQNVMRSRVDVSLEDEPEKEDFGDGYGLEGKRMLVAEDIEINAEILCDILEMEGMEHEWAANGQIAVDMFDDSRNGYYDAILMDIRMPVMDGLMATAAIRSLERLDARTIPIVALTANAFDEDVSSSIEAGMNAHLSKPVEPDKLFELLASLTR